MTIAPDLVAQILRLHAVEKWRVGTIARQLHVHRDVVRRVLAGNCAPVHTSPLRPSRIDLYRPFILATLEKFPTLTAARLHAMVLERGYVGGGSHFRYLVATLRPRPSAEAYLRLRTRPGEQAQVDWGQCRARHRAHYAEFAHMPSDRRQGQAPSILAAAPRRKLGIASCTTGCSGT
jgi:transposase